MRRGGSLSSALEPCAVEPFRNLDYVEPNLTATLEELDRAFVLLGRGAGPERSQVPQLSSLLVRPA